ncbi:hypothetical protein AMAG_16343 [Allomyces macrogynus ATCC 38327]|uniref:UvrD-like helicase ATP-binding domain-containing protein n=1 Tax=Allomyces macrogynus (strain ATCC 38327) TaxID=578462 RepID=A0A0L0TBG8_ALLM3|nr:hypothetical protein AMAG_16343 [Allomyces macrogynus ATCC 38327]|eukprot:KNE71919.1 hypothetical protein AMAG_16343 [Allomyces macrogynus ATCC 38327]
MIGARAGTARPTVGDRVLNTTDQQKMLDHYGSNVGYLPNDLMSRLARADKLADELLLLDSLDAFLAPRDKLSLVDHQGNALEHLPDRFISPAEYAHLQLPLFLEEFRHAMAARIEQHVQGAGPPAYSLGKSAKRSTQPENRSTYVTYSTEVEVIDPRVDRDLLTPGTLAVVGRYPQLDQVMHDGAYVIALLSSAPDMDVWVTTRPNLRVRVAFHARSGSVEVLGDSDLHLIVLGQITGTSRTHSALHELSRWNAMHDKPLLRAVLDPPRDLTAVERELRSFALSAGMYGRHRWLINLKLNAAQMHAISNVVSATQQKVFVVEGPPGTGKTSTILGMLVQLLDQGERCLVTGPTNMAATETAKRLIQFTRHAREDMGSDLPFRLGDMALVGNATRLGLDNDLRLIFVEDRVHRLRALRVAIDAACTATNALLHGFDRVWADHVAEQEHKGKTAVPVGMREMDAMWDYYLATLNDWVVEWGKIHAGIDAVEHAVPTALLQNKHVDEAAYFVERVCKRLKDLVDKAAAVRTVSTQYILSISNSFDQRTLARSYDPAVSQFLATKKRIEDRLGRIYGALHSIIVLCGMSDQEMSQHAKVWFSTVSSSVRIKGTIQTVIVDEAAQLVEGDTSLLLQLPKLRRMVLVGDDRQLPSVVTSDVAKQGKYDRSTLERLKAIGYPTVFLDTQYRMHPRISAFPQQQFYAGMLKDHVDYTKLGRFDRSWHGMGEHLAPYLFIDVEGTESLGPVSLSYSNPIEAEYIKKMLMSVAATLPGGTRVEVGVIAPYTDQCKLLQTVLAKVPGTRVVETNARHNMLVIKGKLVVSINSIDGFQGQERDIIIFSCVRSNSKGNIGFLGDPRRLNVAITRAKYSCWIVGHAETLLKREVWKRLIMDAHSRDLLLDASRLPFYNEVQAVVVAAKVEKLIESATGAVAARPSARRSAPVAAAAATVKSRGQSHFLNFEGAVWESSWSHQMVETMRRMAIDDRAAVIRKMVRVLDGKFGVRFTGKQSSGNLSNMLVTGEAGKYAFVWSLALRGVKDSVKQIIKFWWLGPRSGIAQGVQQARSALGNHSDKYIAVCRKVKRSPGKDDVYMPTTVPGGFEFMRTLRRSTCTEVDLAENTSASQLELIKSYQLNHALWEKFAVESVEALHEFDLLCDLTPQEKELVRQEGSMFCIGRSGTGKTTVMLLKLWQREHVYRKRGSADEPLTQLLLTLSPTLAANLQTQYEKYSKLLPEVSEDMAKKSAPRIASWGNVVDWLDSRLTQPFFQHERVFAAIVDEDQDETVRGTGAVENNDGDVDELQDEWDHDDDLDSDHPIGLHRKDKAVDFGRFERAYYPLLPKPVRAFDPAYLWTQIQGVICGSLEALQSPMGVLTKDGYIGLAAYRTSTLSNSDRATIYNGYVWYARKKRARHEWDMADVVRHIYARGSEVPRDIEYVYVDEAQDLSMAQIALLSLICANPDGFLFAGDTAQTITCSAFRFQDMKATFYSEFLNRIQEWSYRKAKVPPLHTLTQNFRTHVGVLQLAARLVELLVKHFPHSIDQLEPEKALNDGPLPFLFHGDEDAFIRQVFGTSSRRCSLGASQAFLVRDDNEKERVLQMMRRHELEDGQVLTIFESKGLEFNDVLLFNLVSTSPFKKWKLLAKGQHIDPMEHATLAHELKLLYVAVTRAKEGLWIYEERGEGNTLLKMLADETLVRRDSLIDSILTFTRESDPVLWEQQGLKLFDSMQYHLAHTCFKRAGNTTKMALCAAHMAFEDAEKQEGARHGGPQKAAAMYATAAAKFVDLGMFSKAAEAFMRAKRFRDATAMFIKTGALEDALEAAWNTGDLDFVHATIVDASSGAIGTVTAAVLEKCARVATIRSLKKNATDVNVQRFAQLLDSATKQRLFKRYRMSLLLQLNVQEQKYELNAPIYERMHEWAEAAQQWGKSGDQVKAALCARVLVVPHLLALAIGKYDDWPTLAKAATDEMARCGVNIGGSIVATLEVIGAHTNFPQLLLEKLGNVSCSDRDAATIMPVMSLLRARTLHRYIGTLINDKTFGEWTVDLVQEMLMHTKAAMNVYLNLLSDLAHLDSRQGILPALLAYAKDISVPHGHVLAAHIVLEALQIESGASKAAAKGDQKDSAHADAKGGGNNDSGKGDSSRPALVDAKSDANGADIGEAKGAPQVGAKGNKRRAPKRSARVEAKGEGDDQVKGTRAAQADDTGDAHGTGSLKSGEGDTKGDGKSDAKDAARVESKCNVKGDLVMVKSETLCARLSKALTERLCTAARILVDFLSKIIRRMEHAGAKLATRDARHQAALDRFYLQLAAFELMLDIRSRTGDQSLPAPPSGWFRSLFPASISGINAVELAQIRKSNEVQVAYRGLLDLSSGSGFAAGNVVRALCLMGSYHGEFPSPPDQPAFLCRLHEGLTRIHLPYEMRDGSRHWHLYDGCRALFDCFSQVLTMKRLHKTVDVLDLLFHLERATTLLLVLTMRFDSVVLTERLMTLLDTIDPALFSAHLALFAYPRRRHIPVSCYDMCVTMAHLVSKILAKDHTVWRLAESQLTDQLSMNQFRTRLAVLQLLFHFNFGKQQRGLHTLVERGLLLNEDGHLAPTMTYGAIVVDRWALAQNQFNVHLAQVASAGESLFVCISMEPGTSGRFQLNPHLSMLPQRLVVQYPSLNVWHVNIYGHGEKGAAAAPVKPVEIRRMDLDEDRGPAASTGSSAENLEALMRKEQQRHAIRLPERVHTAVKVWVVRMRRFRALQAEQSKHALTPAMQVEFEELQVAREGKEPGRGLMLPVYVPRAVRRYRQLVRDMRLGMLRAHAAATELVKTVRLDEANEDELQTALDEATIDERELAAKCVKEPIGELARQMVEMSNKVEKLNKVVADLRTKFGVPAA